MTRYIAAGIAILWGAGYLIAIFQHDATVAAAGTPVALIAVGWLLRRNGETDA